MQKFVLKELITQNIESELEKIGFDSTYRLQASEKYKYKTIKIFDLTLPQANILKQTALALGSDCAVHRDVLTSNVDKTDVILGGSYSQLKKIAEKLKQQPFSMKLLAEDLISSLEPQKRKTKLVGILNLTPDSFSDGGSYFTEENAVKQLYKLAEDGADIIDIGAESTRPGFSLTAPAEQIERLNLVINEIKNINIPVSIDTRNSEVAKYALDNGVSIINDVSGLEFDKDIIKIASEYNAGVVIQHSKEPMLSNIVDDVYKTFLDKIELVKEYNINNIILDVGIGFGKSREENFELINRIEEFYSLKLPIMVGVSRKSLLGLEKSADNNLKDALTLAVSAPLVQKNVDYLRVHNVKLHKQLLDLAI